MSLATPARPANDRIMTGVVMMIGFCLIAPLIDVCSKFAAQGASVSQITLMRLVVQGGLMLPVALYLGQRLLQPGKVHALVILRSMLLIGSTYSFVAALRFLPIADALAIVFVSPFLTLAIGYFVYGEQVGPRRITASAIGFCGSLLVIQPNFAQFGAVALLPVLTAICFASYMPLTRSISQYMPPESMQALTGVWGVVVMLPLVAIGTLTGTEAFTLSNPEAIVWMQMIGMGLFATISHLMITYALRFAPAATVAPLHYLEIVTGALLGWYFFGDWPNAMSWIGITIIVASGLYIIARERALAKQARA